MNPERRNIKVEVNKMPINSRRKVYRVVPDEAHQLDVAIRTENGKVFRGEVVDVTIDGAGTRFEREAAPAFALGHPVTLIFSAAWLDEPVDVSAKVRSRAGQGEYQQYHYGFAFDQSAELPNRLPKRVFQVFNRRGAPRVPLDPTKPVEVAIKAPGVGTSTVTGCLKDISVSGLALLVEPEAAYTLGALDVIEMSFHLPTRDKAFQLVGWIRNRELVHEHVRYGVEFDHTHSQVFSPAARKIFAYVMHRQQA